MGQNNTLFVLLLHIYIVCHINGIIKSSFTFEEGLRKRRMSHYFLLFCETATYFLYFHFLTSRNPEYRVVLKYEYFTLFIINSKC